MDDLLIAIIIAGIGLSGACLGVQYCEWRKYRDAEKRQAASCREMHAHRMGLQERDICAPRGGAQQTNVDAKSRRLQKLSPERILVHSRKGLTQEGEHSMIRPKNTPSGASL